MKNVFLMLVVLCCLTARSQAQSPLQDAFSRSYKLENDGDYKKAADSLKLFYEENNYGLNLRLGYLYYEAQQYDDSKKYYEKAILLMPNAIEPKLGYALPLSAIGDWNKVVALYQEILNIDPQNTKVNYRMALISYNNKDYKTALAYIIKVTTLFPFDYDSLILDAWINYQLGKTDDAKTLFNRVLLLVPNDSSAKEGLGLIK